MSSNACLSKMSAQHPKPTKALAPQPQQERGKDDYVDQLLMVLNSTKLASED